MKLLKEHVSRNHSKQWNNLYLCDCGAEFITNKYRVKRGHTKSCGCLQSKRASEARTTHGLENSTEYSTWIGMKQRCGNPKNPRYFSYGGRGITVCAEWNESFEAFYRDMGPKPAGTSLDRIDNNKGYSKDNCRWATASQQMKNRRPRTEWKNG